MAPQLRTAAVLAAIAAAAHVVGASRDGDGAGRDPGVFRITPQQHLIRFHGQDGASTWAGDAKMQHPSHGRGAGGGSSGSGRALSYRSDEPDPFGGTTHFSFSGVVFHHVETLDANPLVTGVSCHDEDRITIALSDVRGAEAWALRSETLFAGTSPSFHCLDNAGADAPFIRRALRVISVELLSDIPAELATLMPAIVNDANAGVAGRSHAERRNTHSNADDSAGGQSSERPTVVILGAPSSDFWEQLDGVEARMPARIIFETEAAQPTEAFQSLSLEYHRTPGANEPELRRQLATNATLRRQLGLWDSIASVGSSITGAVTGAVNTVTSTVSAASSALASNGVWGDAKLFEYALVKWNYDSMTRRPAASTMWILNQYAWLKDSYAYLGANVKVSFNFVWATLKSMEVSFYAGAALGIDVQVKLPGQAADTQTVELMPLTALPTISFSIAGIPVNINVKSRVTVTTQVTTSSSGKVVGPGFWLDNSITLGVRYTESGGWSVINERRASLNSRSPSFDVRASAYLSATPSVDIIFSPWNSWDLQVSLKPWLSAKVDFSQGGCGSGKFSLELKTGFGAQIQLFQPAIRLTIFGASYTLTIPGLGSRFPISYSSEVAPAGGSTGCVATFSISDSSMITPPAYGGSSGGGSGSGGGGGGSSSGSSSSSSSTSGSWWWRRAAGEAEDEPRASALEQAKDHSDGAEASEDESSALGAAMSRDDGVADGEEADAVSMLHITEFDLEDAWATGSSLAEVVAARLAVEARAGAWSGATTAGAPGHDAVRGRHATAASYFTFQGRNYTCGPLGCAYEIGAWSRCNVDCGVGWQTRVVRCRRNQNATAMPLEVCEALLGESPSATQACEMPCDGLLVGTGGTFNCTIVSQDVWADTRLQRTYLDYRDPSCVPATVITAPMRIGERLPVSPSCPTPQSPTYVCYSWQFYEFHMLSSGEVSGSPPFV